MGSISVNGWLRFFETFLIRVLRKGGEVVRILGLQEPFENDNLLGHFRNVGELFKSYNIECGSFFSNH